MTNTEYNPLDELFKDRLAQQAVPAHDKEALWKKIEAQLDKPKTQKNAFWIPLCIGIAMAASVFGFLFVSPAHQEIELPIQQGAITQQSTDYQKDNTTENAVATTTEAILEENQNSTQKIAEKTNQRATLASLSTSIPIQANKQKQPIAEQPNTASSDLQVAEAAIAYSKTFAADSLALALQTLDAQQELDKELEQEPETVIVQVADKRKKKKVNIVVRFGQPQDEPTSQAAVAHSDDLHRAKTILREAWNFKAGRRVDWQNIIHREGQHSHH
jgi:hypothetical protein